MHKQNLIGRWAGLVAIIFLLLAIGCGGHIAVPTTPTTATPQTILFSSWRALDGSDAANSSLLPNVWVVNEDGTGAKPLTKFTAHLTGASDAAWSPDGQKILFDSDGALDGSDASLGTTNIWVMNADGTGATPLTKMMAAISAFPTWSPDGSKIVFVSNAAFDGSDAAITVGNIWVMNADGSGRTPVTTLTSAKSIYPSWSPDGKTIAFMSDRALDGSDSSTSSTLNIWTVKPDGTGATPLTNLTSWTANVWSAAWSPDSTKIAYGSNRLLNGNDFGSEASNIWVVSADGTNTTPLTEFAQGIQNVGYVRWSPDGRKIAFAWDHSFNGAINAPMNLFVMNADGFGMEPLTRLTTANALLGSFSWSSDGQKIAVCSDRALDGSDAEGTGYNIWIVNADGTGAQPLTKLTNKDAQNADPLWRP